MNLGNLYKTTRAIIFEPEKSWEKIYDESRSRRNAIYQYLLPMALLVTLASLTGNIFNGDIHDGTSVSFILFNCIISFLIIFLEVYLSGWLISEVASSFNPVTDGDRIFNLVIYSQAPFYLCLTLIKIFPELSFLIVAGFYTFYIYWVGMIKFAGLKPENRSLFMLLSIIIMLTSFAVLSFVFRSIYDIVIDQIIIFGPA